MNENITERKHFVLGTLFALSFFYFAVAIILFYEDYLPGIPLGALAFIIYDLVYLFFLRKREKQSFLRVLARGVSCAAWGWLLVTVHMYAELYRNGTSVGWYGLFYTGPRDMVYGFDAWVSGEAALYHLFFLLPSVIGIIYNMIYIKKTRPPKSK